MSMSEIWVAKNLNDIFAQKINSLPIKEAATKAYIVGVLTARHTDYSNESISLIFLQAKLENKFELFQSIGDYLLFTQSIFPKHLSSQAAYYDNIAQFSYYKCHLILNKKWELFEELSDKFVNLYLSLRQIIHSV